MKVDDLKKLIELLIRKEVKKIVAEEVNKAMGKVLVEMVKEVKNNGSRPQITETIEPVEEESIQEVIRTKNPKLNKVLAETARYSRPLQHSDAGLVDLMDGGFERIGQSENIGLTEPSTNMDFLKQMVAATPVPTAPSVLDNGGAAVPDVLKKVFKKDFRATMKKMDDIKKNGGSGMINPGMFISSGE